MQQHEIVELYELNVIVCPSFIDNTYKNRQSSKLNCIENYSKLVQLYWLITYGHVSSNRYAITNLQVRMAEVNKTLMAALSDVKFVKYSVAIINDIRIILAKLTLGVMSLEQNVNAIYEYLRVLSSRQVNPLIIPPDSLRKVLAHVKEDMKRNPRLQLPEDPNINIWNYYSIMKVTPIVVDDILLIILTIPLTD